MSSSSDATTRRRLRAFRAAGWLPGATLQTMVPALLRRLPRAYQQRVRLDLPDGDFLDLDIAEPPGAPRGFVVLVHGLEGSSDSIYIRGTADVALRRGLAVVALNQRGCSGTLNRLPRSYHAGASEDPRAALAFALERWPDLRGGLIGFSLGGNQTLKMLGEEAAGPAFDLGPRVVGGVAVSPPFDMHAVAAMLDSAAGAIYRAWFLRTLVPKALKKARRFPDLMERRRIMRSALRLRAFDEAVTAPVHGFASAADYYDRSVCTPYLAGIRRPTLVLTALDDPIIPGRTVPLDALEAHPRIEVVATPLGGHVGFVAGTFERPRYWAEQQAVLWLLRLLGGGQRRRGPQALT